MCIGQALYENLIRIDGRVMNPSFRDYKMPLATDVPKLEHVAHINVITNDPSGPFGAKEAGEGAATAAIAAVANAVHNATGLRMKSLPISADRILLGLRRLHNGENQKGKLETLERGE